MPYWVEPRLARYTSDWMYDIQFWDIPWLRVDASSNVEELSAELRSAAGGRRIVGSLGHQRRLKGLDYFITLADDAALKQRFLFVMIGPIWDVDRKSIAEFVGAGGIVIEREVGGQELVALYSVVDVVWACYRPDYDQSSGIFGRAVQLGKPTIVRESSYLSRLQSGLGQPGWVIPFGKADKAVGLLSLELPVEGLGDRPRERNAGFLRSLLA